eukprot:12419176-Karenia_brevis.AAC.1
MQEIADHEMSLGNLARQMESTRSWLQQELPKLKAEAFVQEALEKVYDLLCQKKCALKEFHLSDVKASCHIQVNIYHRSSPN